MENIDVSDIFINEILLWCHLQSNKQE